MLNKGIVTYSKNGLMYVWSKELGGEAVLDKRMNSADDQRPSLGKWIVFSMKDRVFIDEYTEIPNILPTKVDDRGVVMVKTRILFHSDDYRCNLLAHSKELGLIGIFRKFPDLDEHYDYDVWVERIPQTLSNLERLYEASWCVSGQPPEPILRGNPAERFSTMDFAAKRSQAGCLGNINNEKNCSDIEICTSGSQSSLSSVTVFGDLQERDMFRELNSPKQSLSAVERCFDPQPCTSVDETEEEDVAENEVAIGLITSTYNRTGFVWSSVIGEGIIPAGSVERMRHGDWVKFIPSHLDGRYLQGYDGTLKCRYIAKECCVVDPLYPTYPFRSTVSVQVKLYVPFGYRFKASNLWVEYFGTVSDALGRIAEFATNTFLGHCLLVRIIKMKNKSGFGSKWVVHKVLRNLQNEESLPFLKSPSFAADALRYMIENSQIYDAMKKADSGLTELSREPHLLPDDILTRRK